MLNFSNIKTQAKLCTLDLQVKSAGGDKPLNCATVKRNVYFESETCDPLWVY